MIPCTVIVAHAAASPQAAPVPVTVEPAAVRSIDQLLPGTVKGETQVPSIVPGSRLLEQPLTAIANNIPDKTERIGPPYKCPINLRRGPSHRHRSRVDTARRSQQRRR